MLIYALLFALSVFHSIETQCRCGRRAQLTRIVNGTEAPEGAYPWLVSVQTYIVYRNKMERDIYCGGSIINSEWILTAAHCFIEDEPDPNAMDIIARHTYVIVGTNDNSMTRKELFHVDNNLNAQHLQLPNGVHKVAQVITHEGYNRTNFQNDIALLRVEKSFVFGPKISPVCLETASNDYYPSIHVAGWGAFGTNIKGGSRRMYHITVKEFLFDDCHRHWPWVSESKHLCYRGEDGYKGVCKGDSGGPLVISKDDIHYQVGIVSWTHNVCETLGVPDGAIRVSFYDEWIYSNANTGTWCNA